MSKVRLAAIGLVVVFAWICSPSFASGQERITLYSVLKHRDENRVFCFDFRGQVTNAQLGRPCYFRYGALYVGHEHDWLESAAVLGNRSVIKDLGEKDWADQLQIPVVEPLRRLQPGEQRMVTIDASGADGADGSPGLPGQDAVNADRSTQSSVRQNASARTEVGAAKPKHDGKPRVDPSFVRAVVGHMYVMRVVYETDDFYVLFRVEHIERGSSCTISWMHVPAPSAQVVQN